MFGLLITFAIPLSFIYSILYPGAWSIPVCVIYIILSDYIVEYLDNEWTEIEKILKDAFLDK